MIALHQRANDYARFLPAVNRNSAEFAVKPASALKRPLPANLVPRQLDFLHPNGLFNHPWALYTAAEGVSGKAPTTVSQRNRKTSFVIGDSGGFSLISGAVKTLMSVFRAQSLAWIERDCDVGLPLDVPTRAIDKQPGVWDFAKCLATTLDNTDWAIDKKQPKTRLLAVYQGRNHREADRWTASMKTRLLYGIALGGHTRLDFWYWTRSIKRLIDQGDFAHIRHIHVLGTTEPGVAVLLTALKRALRSYLKRDDLEVTFDSSRAYRITQAYKQISMGLRLGMQGSRGAADAFDFRSFTLPRDGGQVDRLAPFPFDSPLGRLCTMGDFMPGVSPADPAFDPIGLNLLSYHETYMELAAIEQANLLCDMQQQLGSLVPWHIESSIEAIHDLFANGNETMFTKRRTSLQHYNRGALGNGLDDFR